MKEEAPNFTSPVYSDSAHWVSGLRQEVLLSDSLSTGRLVRLEDKEPDSRGSSRVHGQYKVTAAGQ